LTTAKIPFAKANFPRQTPATPRITKISAVNFTIYISVVQHGRQRLAMVGYQPTYLEDADARRAILHDIALWIGYDHYSDGKEPLPVRNFKKSDKKHGIIVPKNPITVAATEIRVLVPEQAQINLAIYDNTGNVVYKTSGRNTDTFVWDLKNNAGRDVANGSYLIIAEAKGANGNYAYSAKVGVKK